MNMIIFIFIGLFSNLAQADGPAVAKILVAKNPVQLDSRTLHAGDEIKTEGTLKTSGASGAKLELLPSHTILEIAPGSEVALKAEPVLISGMVRAKVVKNPAAKKPIFFIRGRAATAGVRGTDFLLISNFVWGESEIVVFDGQVEFGSNTEPTDKKLVTPGHWGGLGGRFGKKIADLIQLPDTAIKYFNEVSTVK
jgi:hypothetical protein